MPHIDAQKHNCCSCLLLYFVLGPMGGRERLCTSTRPLTLWKISAPSTWPIHPQHLIKFRMVWAGTLFLHVFGTTASCGPHTTISHTFPNQTKQCTFQVASLNWAALQQRSQTNGRFCSALCMSVWYSKFPQRFRTCNRSSVTICELANEQRTQQRNSILGHRSRLNQAILVVQAC